MVVSDLLREMGYSLQSNRKTDEGKQNPDLLPDSAQPDILDHHEHGADGEGRIRL